MMKRTRRKLLYALATFSSMVASPGAYAKISPLAFKGVTKCFKKGKAFFSPTVGEAALESGLIYDLRFYGNFEAAHKKEGGVETRDYIKDNSKDPVWNVVKTLFPSSGGQLSGESTFLTSFGKVVDDPQSIAVLLNFVNKIREGEKIDESKLEERFFETLSPSATGTQDEHERLEAVLSELENILLTDDKGESITKGQFEKAVNGLLDQHNLTRLQSQIQKEINKVAAARAQGTLEEKLMRAKEASTAFLKKSLETGIKKKEEAFKKEFSKETLGPLIDYLKKAMAGEKDALYPERTTEQILLAFFCYKFNTQDDIWTLLRHLDDSIVDKTMIPALTDELKEEDLSEIAAHDVYDLDDILDLETADIWSQITPYREGSPLLSNGNAYKYDRANDQLLKKEATFADCQEITLRHLMNLLFYDPVTKGWDLSAVEKHLQEKDPANPYFQNVKDFYVAQTPSLSNAGDTNMRSLFNKVVGDLNDGRGPEIKYMKGTNELNAGFINMMRVFEKLFSLPLKAFPAPLEGKPKETFEARQEWLKDSFETLFKVLSPTRTFQLDLSKLSATEDEISGTLPVKVKDLFSFNLSSEVNHHAQMTDLKNLKKEQSESYEKVLASHQTSLQEGTAEEALWLLSSNPTLKAEKIHEPLYGLFHTPLTDNDSRIQFLGTLSESFPSWLKASLVTPQGIETIQSMLKNVLENISWEDWAVLEKVSPYVWRLCEREALKETIFSGVRGLHLKNKTELEALPKFKNLAHLYAQALAAEELPLKGLEALEVIVLRSSGVRKIEGLEAMKNLRKLDLRETRNLEDLSLKGCDALEVIDLGNSGVRKIEGLETMKNLKRLGLDSTLNLEEVSLKGCDALKMIALGNSGVRKLGLEAMKSLMRLDLAENRKLEEVFLKGCGYLEEIDLGSSGVRKLGLEAMKSLMRLDLAENRKLEEVFLKGCDALEVIDLGSSGVRKIEGLETMKNLKRLGLDSTLNLEEVSLKGCDALEEIDLSGSGVRKIEGLEDMKSLKDLNLGETRNLEELSLTNLSSLNNLIFNGSGVQKLVLKNLTSLGDLDLSSLTNLTSVRFEGDFSALTSVRFSNSAKLDSIECDSCTWNENIKFDFSNSGIKGRTQIKGLDLDDDRLHGLAL